MENAPLYTDIARGPDGGEAAFLTCQDGVRVRTAHWPGGDKGTMFLFQGRTEFIEKYGPTAKRFVEMGYHVVAIDFRGQGLSDRFGKHRNIGHVEKFSDFQYDIDAVMEFAASRGVPEPFYSLNHSMGGAIGLRAILRGLPFEKAIFTGPMWQIYFRPIMRPISKVILGTANLFNFDDSLAPTTKLRNYVFSAPFENNTLTNDREEWDWAQYQMTTHPDVELGGPSLRWLDEAIAESTYIRHAPPKSTPLICLCGENERINSKDAMRQLMARWPNGRYIEIPNAQHEILVSEPEAKKAAWGEISRFLQEPESKANAA